jgi:hypothetical protein
MIPDFGKGRGPAPWLPSSLPAVLLLAVLLLAAVLPVTAHAAVTAYLPLDLSPEVESRIERLLTLAGVPVMTRPIRVATVLDALSAACLKDRSLCRQVRRDLAPYGKAMAITGVGAEAAATQSNPLVQPQQHGAAMDSHWQANASAFGRFNDYALLSAGVVGYEGRTTPTGSMLSVGGEPLQLDVGYRDHSWSPFRLGTMLIGSEAATMPSATISNVVPFTSAHLRYEMFLAQMSFSDRIEWQDGYTAGHPKLFGFHLDVELAPGWSLGLSRIMQYGGGARPDSLNDMFRAFFNPAKYNNTNASTTSNQDFGNEQVAFSSEFVVPGRMPMSLYVEYAAEDTFHSENYRLGSSSLSAGFYLPRLLPNLQLRYEFAEWQSNWYVNHIYQDGMTNYHVVIGQWGGMWRRPGDNVGAQSNALQLTWDLDGGRQLDLQYRTILNGSYTGGNYQRGQELGLSFSRPWRSLQAGVRVDGGRDEYGDSFGRIAVFARYAGGQGSYSHRAAADDDESGSADAAGSGAAAADTTASRRTEGFVDFGMFSSKMDYEQDAGAVPAENTTHGSFHVGLGVRRAFGRHYDFGTRIEFDNVAGKLFTAVRAIDYRYRFGPTFAAGFFFGAARYDAETPAYGWYGGAGVQWRDLWEKWDAGVDYRIGDHMVRNKTPGEPVIIWPNAFYTIKGVSLYMSRRF